MRKTFEERFWSRVNKHGPTVREELGPCWLWTGTPHGAGYGTVSYKGKQWLTHRVSYELRHGEGSSETVCVLHKCDVRLCVNPDHTWGGDRTENAKDRDEKKRLPTGEQHWSKKNPEKTAKGESNGKAKLTEKDVLEIRQYAALGIPQVQIAKMFGIWPGITSQIINRKRWVHVVAPPFDPTMFLASNTAHL